MMYHSIRRKKCILLSGFPQISLSKCQSGCSIGSRAMVQQRGSGRGLLRTTFAAHMLN